MSGRWHLGGDRLLFGRRTMRLVDFGKVAATLVDVETRRAVRIWPRDDVLEMDLSRLEPVHRWSLFA